MATTLNPFINVTANSIMIEAFERLGVVLPELVGNPLYSAINSLNILFTDWARYNNLYSIKPFMANVIQGQKNYQLPIGTADIPEREVSVASITRQLGGIASSSAGGVAQNAFDGNPNTACTQTTPNGNITYLYNNNNGYGIDYIGIQSNVTATYNIVIEYAPIFGADWVTAINTGSQDYEIGQQVWYVNPTPQLAKYWRIRETGGATLNIQEVYFCTHNISRQLSLLSRSQYLGISTKDQQGSVSSYVFNRDVNPSITLWPVPDGAADYPYLILNLKVLNPQITTLTDVVAIPSRFYEALCAGLAVKLAEKARVIGVDVPPDKIARLAAQAEKAMEDIEQEDTEHSPYIFQFNL